MGAEVYRCILFGPLLHISRDRGCKLVVYTTKTLDMKRGRGCGPVREDLKILEED